MTLTFSPRILVVAATARELAPPDGWLTLACGVGPVDAAAATSVAIAQHAPSLVLHVGIAGARRENAFAPAQLIIGSSAHYCDLNVPPKWAPRVIDAPTQLVAAARRVFPSAVVCAIGTSARVGGSAHSATPVDVEAMEGFGVLRAAQLAGVPAIEVRAISNAIEEADRGLWQFDEAFAAITSATPKLVFEFLSSEV